ncbi:hypothetical protein ACGC1H_003108 [Rhizoctonia solani]
MCLCRPILLREKISLRSSPVRLGREERRGVSVAESRFCTRWPISSNGQLIWRESYARFYNNGTIQFGLRWDIIARFGAVKVGGEPLPPQFFTDWVKVAEDEAKHFSLLSSRLTQLGTYYGSQAVHAGLWDSATRTSHSLSARLCIIHLVHEARGLDVNPITINKFKNAGDNESVKVLEVIHWDEVTHVTAGHRWFTWACNLLDEDPVQTFRREVKAHFSGALKGPFNTVDRARAGMSPDFYEGLGGETLESKDTKKGPRLEGKKSALPPLDDATTKPGQNVGADGSVEVSYQ